MNPRLALLLDRSQGRVLLRSPEVGTFTCALPEGSLLAPGSGAGVLHSLGRRYDLVVPDGVTGRVLRPPPEAVHAPVAYGTVLYELAPLESSQLEREAADERVPGTGALLFRAPYSGRFWQRPAPGDPPFVNAGDALGEGQTIGLIEVMKTFTQLVYRSGGELPARARLVRFLVADGGEIESGGALLELTRE